MEIILSLGSNLGNREENLAQALQKLTEICHITKESTVLETEPWGKEDQASFLNQVVVANTHLTPNLLMKKILEIERVLGRVRGEKWGPRIIDIDILYYDDLIINQEEIKIPHPLLQERIFVLEPLKEIYADKIDPRFNLSVEDLYNKLTGCP